MRIRGRLEAPVDAASLIFFRVALGTLLAFAVVRFWAKGGIFDAFVVPRFFFPYAGLEWLRPLPGICMYVVYAAMFVLAIGFAAGVLYRVCAAGLCLLFTYAHLADASNYLNHYYLVSLLLLIATFLPLHSARTVPAWMLWLVRFQIGLVYFFGGVAKLEGDWLFRAMPLRIWLAAAGDFPVLGPVLVRPETAFVMSWLGALFDLSTPWLLLHRRTRPLAYALVCVFHLVTARLFQIGMFPWIMIAAALVFFDPSWPRRWFGRWLRDAPAVPPPMRPWILSAYVAVQILIPLRHWLRPGSVLWTEDGYRFSWRVMLVEKTGSVELLVEDPVTGHAAQTRLRDELTPFQVKMMATQPDMIVAYARHLADAREVQGAPRPRVHADARVALNGRAAAPLFDPSADLADTSLDLTSCLLAPPDDVASARAAW